MYAIPLIILINILFIGLDDSWKDLIKPLETNRSQVEKILGDPQEGNCSRCSYKTDDREIIVYYATERCQGFLPGWDVPKDTVLSFTVYTRKTQNISEISQDRSKYLITSADTGGPTYFDLENGRAYGTDHLGVIGAIIYFPPENKRDKRCNGFPEFNIVGKYYYRTEIYSNVGIKDGKAILDTVATYLIGRSDLKVYLVIYRSKENKLADFEKYISEMKGHLCKDTELLTDSVEIIEGGEAKYFYIDVFVLDKNYPPPVPDPFL